MRVYQFRHLGLYERQTRLNALDLEFVFTLRAANETRTRDPDLGKVVLYQLSYCRLEYWIIDK